MALDVRWRPFQLDPALPAQGVPYKDYMQAKFGGAGERNAEQADRFAAMRAHLEAAAPGAGITYRFGEIATRPNTLGAHRLIRWAQGQGVGDAAVEALFAAFFDELRDVGDPQVLSAIAGQIGLDATLVADLLAGDADRDSVREEEALFRNMGVTSVPTFIAGGRLALPGAHEPETIAQFLDEAAGLPDIAHATDAAS